MAVELEVVMTLQQIVVLIYQHFPSTQMMAVKTGSGDDFYNR